MKWGIRRYQYPDGTRTELGRRRERKAYYFKNDLYRRDQDVYDSLSRMSMKELKSSVDRLRMENQYVSLINEREVNIGKNRTQNYLNVLKTVVGVGGSAVGTVLTIKKLMGK